MNSRKWLALSLLALGTGCSSRSGESTNHDALTGLDRPLVATFAAEEPWTTAYGVGADARLSELVNFDLYKAGDVSCAGDDCRAARVPPQAPVLCFTSAIGACAVLLDLSEREGATPTRTELTNCQVHGTTITASFVSVRDAEPRRITEERVLESCDVAQPPALRTARLASLGGELELAIDHADGARLVTHGAAATLTATTASHGASCAVRSKLQDGDDTVIDVTFQPDRRDGVHECRVKVSDGNQTATIRLFAPSIE